MRRILPDVKNPFIKKIYQRLRLFIEGRYLSVFFKNNKVGGSIVHAKGKVLVYSVIGSVYNSRHEMLLAHLLQKEGYEVDYVICDGIFEACEVLTKERLETVGKKIACESCSKRSKYMLEHAGIRCHTITGQELHKYNLEGKSLEELLHFKLDGIDFGNIISGVMYRYYKSLNYGSDAKQIAFRYLKSALTSYLYVKTLDQKQNYRYMFFSHGIYSSWGPIVEYCKLNAKDFVSYDRGKRKATANFNLNLPAPIWDFTTAWDRYSDRELSKQEANRVEEYLAERELQKNDAYAYNFNAKELDIDLLKARLGISKDKKVITLFTNLIWDAANVSRDLAFSSMLECVVKTITYYAAHAHVHVVVRTHPAEKVLGTNETYKQLIIESIPSMPFNVTILDASENVNSFSVLEMTDIGVIHTSTVGLEMAIEGKPAVLISETHYRGKGFTYDISSEHNYFNTLNELLKTGNILPDQVMLSKKYFYMMMFLYQKPMPMQIQEGVFNGYTASSFNELEQTEEIVKVIKALDKKDLQDFVFWD